MEPLKYGGLCRWPIPAAPAGQVRKQQGRTSHASTRGRGPSTLGRRRPLRHRRRMTPLRALASVTMAALFLGACSDDSDGGNQSAALAVPATAVDDASSFDGEFAVVEGFLVAAPESPHRLCAAL